MPPESGTEGGLSLLALEPLIMERLGALLSGEVAVFPAAALDAITGGNQPAPAVYVLYDSGAVTESRPDGLAVRIAQTWVALVVVRYAAQGVGGPQARLSAGEIADEVINALMGWQPTGTSQPLRLVDLPSGGAVPGYQIVPLQFSTEIIRRVEPGL